MVFPPTFVRLIVVDTSGDLLQVYVDLSTNPPPGFLVLECTDLDSLLRVLDEYAGSLCYLEMVAHGTPDSCGPIDTAAILPDPAVPANGKLTTWIRANTPPYFQLILSGCNTGACQMGPNIAEQCARVMERSVFGARGYLDLAGLYATGLVLCSRDNFGDSNWPVYCCTVDTNGRRSFTPAQPFPNASLYTLVVRSLDPIQLDNPSIAEFAGTIRALIDALKSKLEDVGKPPSPIPVNPRIAADVRILDPTDKQVYSILGGGMVIRDDSTGLAYRSEATNAEIESLRGMWTPRRGDLEPPT